MYEIRVYKTMNSMYLCIVAFVGDGLVPHVD